ncbi:MAG TPA: phosphonate C-P lyase system protein PhnG [Bacillus bacterium]|uniref:Phosphonate C-P lyase system protein PhnG n=1 Tax=Siminovitchia fordii TaxID=254759 RepID=A0ABQ4K872_9BACI|nr:phosphonate C-P lyase system protein PhnG [Siminovitchia fordii]GIN21916.1 phosphonate C-P lyase system protein PhnG [Siminovitchia fordii]HBZ11798.1 phosphonate C-P lyase system protein PhnG [Bacillus sp. (in: firmicutes)]
MKRNRRMRILIEGSRDIPKKLAQEIENNHSLEIIMKPQGALTMIKMRETAKKTLFYLGEVLVTECKVKVKDQVGIGIVIGMEEDLAYQLAVIDAAFKADLSELNKWIQLLEEEERRIEASKRLDAAVIQKTKVNFETMDV